MENHRIPAGWSGILKLSRSKKEAIAFREDGVTTGAALYFQLMSY
jgi:hypothetical protein